MDALAFTIGTEIGMPDATNDANVAVVGDESIGSETPSPDFLERGLLIGGKTVPASSGRLADDLSPSPVNDLGPRRGARSGISNSIPVKVAFS